MSIEPTTKDINDMANLMEILNEKSEGDEVDSKKIVTEKVVNEDQKIEITEMTAQEMKRSTADFTDILSSLGGLLEEEPEVEGKIQETFHRAATSAADEIRSNPKLRESLETRTTPTGFIYGEWELIERQDKKKTYFTIRHTGTAEILAKDLMLRESALVIVKLLNEGLPINSSQTFDALNVDMKYKSAIFDMTNLNRKKGPISEDKYEQARDKACFQKKRARLILEGLRGIK